MPAKYGDEESTIEYRTHITKVSMMLFRNFLWRLKVQYVLPRVHPVALFYSVGALSPLG